MTDDTPALELEQLLSLQEAVGYLEIEETVLTNAARQNKTLIPLRLGYKLFATHRMLDEWMKGYLFGKRQDANPHWPVAPTESEKSAYLSVGQLHERVNDELQARGEKTVSFSSFSHQLKKSNLPRKEDSATVVVNTQEIIDLAVSMVMNRPRRGRQLGWQASE